MSFQDASQQDHATYPIAPGGSAQSAPDNSQATPQASGSGSSGSTQPQSRQAAEEARKDRTLAEFMLMLDEYEPLVGSKVFIMRNDLRL
jgi:transcription initiation factor TFIID subunit 10